MLVFMEGGKLEYPVKNPRNKDESQQQTQPTYDTETGNRTRATLVEGECSHIIERYIPDAVLSCQSWPSFYLVINKVKSGSIKTPLENVRNQTLANLLHSFKVERLNNVRGLFRC